MATELLTIAATAAQSADIDATTAAVLVGLKGAGSVPQGCYVAVEYKSADGAYFPFAILSSDYPMLRLEGGTFRLNRGVTPTAIGADDLTNTPEG